MSNQDKLLLQNHIPISVCWKESHRKGFTKLCP